MSLNNIELNNHLVAAIYGNSLIDCNSVTIKNSNIPSKEVLVFYEKTKDQKKTDSNQLIRDILSACKINPEKVLLVEFETEGEFFPDKLIDEKKPSSILVLGHAKKPEGLSNPDIFYKIRDYAGIPLLSAPSPEILAADKESKKKLWNSLRSFFNLD